MIRGIGVDLCDIERMKKAVGRSGFLKRIFSEEEIDYAERKAVPAAHYAGAFAAREALAKAGRWGIAKMGLESCSIRRTEFGPEFIFTEEFSARLKAEKIDNVFLSISHEGNIAAAMVVLEGEQ
ncbi:MAG: holo-ACP synthase [Synergistaceae bacterium]|nr:holo-ACP synthase [Synergistaceae bacterium]